MVKPRSPAAKSPAAKKRAAPAVKRVAKPAVKSELVRAAAVAASECLSPVHKARYLDTLTRRAKWLQRRDHELDANRNGRSYDLAELAALTWAVGALGGIVPEYNPRGPEARCRETFEEPVHRSAKGPCCPAEDPDLDPDLDQPPVMPDAGGEVGEVWYPGGSSTGRAPRLGRRYFPGGEL